MNACVLLMYVYLPKTLSRKQASKKFSAVDQTRPWHRAALLLMAHLCSDLFVLCIYIYIYVGVGVGVGVRIRSRRMRSSEGGDGEGRGEDKQKDTGHKNGRSHSRHRYLSSQFVSFEREVCVSILVHLP